MLGTHIPGREIKRVLTDRLRRLRREEGGVTAIEYGLIAGAIAVAIIATVIALGGDINNLFAATGNALTSTAGSSL